MKTTPFTAGELVLGLEVAGIYEYDVRENYSGRAMYGEKCFGITHEREYSSLISIAIVEAVRQSGIEEAEDAIDEALTICKSATGDSMGLNSITYFPGWTLKGWNGEEDAEDD